MKTFHLPFFTNACRRVFIPRSDRVGPILFVSHRLHVLPKLCDRIYVMEDNYRI